MSERRNVASGARRTRQTHLRHVGQVAQPGNARVAVTCRVRLRRHRSRAQSADARNGVHPDPRRPVVGDDGLRPGARPEWQLPPARPRLGSERNPRPPSDLRRTSGSGVVADDVFTGGRTGHGDHLACGPVGSSGLGLPNLWRSGREGGPDRGPSNTRTGRTVARSPGAQRSLHRHGRPDDVERTLGLESRVAALVDNLLAQCHRRALPLGTAVGDAEQAAAATDEGYSFIMVSNDAAMFAKAATKLGAARQRASAPTETEIRPHRGQSTM